MMHTTSTEATATKRRHGDYNSQAPGNLRQVLARKRAHKARSGPTEAITHIINPAGLVLETLTDADAERRERTRRTLIYAHMRETTCRLWPKLVHEWPYQPTEEEVTAAIEELKC